MSENHFSSLPLSSELLTVLQELGFAEMTPIQQQSMPLLLAGKDIIGQAKTGSGKTAAFALPILNKIKIEEAYLQALILCPTRELAAQVVGEIRKLGRRMPGLQVLSLTGGQSGREQVQSLENGVQIAVGTPGRVADFVTRSRVDLSGVKTVVLDEADKMLDMGFADEIKTVMRDLPGSRQTVFFSATFPESIEHLSRKYQRHVTQVTIEEENDTNAIEQIVYDSEDDDKTNTLMRVLQQHPSDSTIVFCNTKLAVDSIAELLTSQGVPAGALHGDMEQRERDRVMALFRNKSHRILVATDVAARGLDIDHLELVVNFDLPLSPEIYVHRIGRTGRAGKSGIAVTLAHPRDTLKLTAFSDLTGVKLQRPSLGFKNQYGLNKNLREAPMKTISISGGRKDKLRPGDILGALTGDAGLSGADVGKIEIQDRISYVAVANKVADTALQKLRDGRIKGQKFQVKFAK
ncbi:ATP-dependent RNA helicase DbpA [Bdellovibrio bacteriovorus]|uniref:ATP-dependent RNA helicase DbpA n=1 Tax=Bdellovibrio bacteriovorus TaxID=959 RepID=UPI0021D223A8|nr:ATP-dependent RNA helicase DbpA [Bdellovibrio bacteriovorus]UXR63931.1 ATP-dependent RNA helicase DbpA [Bdellovibrio bacteriovorus]